MDTKSIINEQAQTRYRNEIGDMIMYLSLGNVQKDSETAEDIKEEVMSKLDAYVKMNGRTDIIDGSVEDKRLFNILRNMITSSMEGFGYKVATPEEVTNKIKDDYIRRFKECHAEGLFELMSDGAIKKGTQEMEQKLTQCAAIFIKGRANPLEKSDSELGYLLENIYNDYLSGQNKNTETSNVGEDGNLTEPVSRDERAYIVKEEDMDIQSHDEDKEEEEEYEPEL